MEELNKSQIGIGKGSGVEEESECFWGDFQGWRKACYDVRGYFKKIF